MFQPRMNKQSIPIPGCLAISAAGELQMKLFWKSAGDTNSLAHALRDKIIIDPAAIRQAALDLGFEGLLVVTRKGRITEDGQPEEPAKPDVIREKFTDDSFNPFGSGTVLTMSMSDEFDNARKLEERKAARR